jgi:hypothetical protein
MSRVHAALALAAWAVATPVRAASFRDVLAANREATGGSAWDGKATLALEYAYAGQGLAGTVSSLEDLQRGAFVDRWAIGPNAGASGFDGRRAWEQEPSGTVTDQAGGDVVPLAVNEAFRDQNLWWRGDLGGATVTAAGERTAEGVVFDVLTVAPRGGKPFQAWFDRETHLLARTVEVQVVLTVTTSFSDYAAVDGVLIARTLVVDDGSGPANRQTMTLKSAAFSPARPLEEYQRPRTSPHDFSLAGGVAETTVPFRLVNNHVYADVSVNGSKPLPFLLDTGGHDILTPATARALQIEAQGTQTSTGAGEGIAYSGVARVGSIAIGAATLTDQPVTVLDIAAPGVEGVEEAGIVGYEFLARFVTRFDYGARTVTFIDKARFDPRDAGTPIPIELFHQFPEVRGSYDGIPGRFGIDTGARTAVTLTGPFAAKHGIRAKKAKGAARITGWGVGGASRAFVWRGGVLKLGAVTVRGPVTELSADRGGAGAAEAFPNNIGGGLLKRFVVTIDYDHSTLYLKPVAGPVPDLDTFDRSGMWINAAAGGFQVADVAAGGPAGVAGLRPGDVIVQVDGQPAGGLALSALRERWRNQAPGTVVALTVKRGAAARTVKLTLRDQV